MIVEILSGYGVKMMNDWDYNDLSEDFVEGRDSNIPDSRSIIYFDKPDIDRVVVLVHINGKVKKAIIEKNYIEKLLRDV